MISIGLKEVQNLAPGSFVYVDMRGEISYGNGHIPGAINWNRDDPTDVLPKDKKLIVYCSIGVDSVEAAEKLREQGFDAYSLKNGMRDWLVSFYTDLTPEEMHRYDRQMILPEIGAAGQKKLKESSVLIVGAGGLGSPAAMYLAGAGIGTLGIMDADEVSVSNLHRQIIHTPARVGVNKAESAEQTIRNYNELIKVNTHTCYLTPDNAEELIGQYDFIIDGVDNFETKFLINDTCVIMGKPFCSAGILQFFGQIMTYVPGKDCPCYRCIFEEIPQAGTVQNCSQAGVVGPVAGIAGCLQALEAIKYITDSGELLTGKVLAFDGLSMEFETVEIPEKNEACRVCGKNKNITDVKENSAEYYHAACAD